MRDFEPKSLTILGRQPALGLAELESLYGPEHVRPLGGHALLDVSASEIDFKRLGGTIKVAQLLTVLPSPDWKSTYNYLVESIPRHLKNVPGGTFTLGVSVYGPTFNIAKLNADLLSLKKVIRASGRSVRIVPNKTLELSSAQVLHNKLTHRGAWELLLVRAGGKTYIAQTLFVQDIEAYAARDQARPKRDARVGMLPPKLAQILINLAVGQVSRSQIGDRRSDEPQTTNDKLRPTRLLDPFCGTGVILQEALLMGYHVIGSDIDPRLVDFAKTNIQWLVQKYPVTMGQVVIEIADATTYQWPRFSALASEVYLGRPLAALPSPAKLQGIINDVNTIVRKFLQNLLPQLKTGQKAVLAVPAWKLGNNFKHLPLIDHLTDMGYNRVSFVHTSSDHLIYFREDQIVARELLVLEKV